MEACAVVQQWAAVTGTCWHEPAAPMQMVHIPSAPNHEYMLGRRILLPLSHMCSFFQITKIHGGFQGGRRDLVWKMALLCAWQDFIQAYSWSEGRPNVHPQFECASQHSCGKVACRLPAACCDFFCVHLCMYWLCIILQTCLCLPASPKNPQLCLLSHMCWMPLAHQEHGLKVLPIPWTDAKRDSVFTHLELCISSLSLASGLQVVWLMGVDSLGSSCGQCSVFIRGRAVLGGFFTSWCVNFLLDQHIEQSHPTCLPVAVSVARKATGSGGRTGSLLHAAHGHTRLCLTSNCCLTYLLLTLDVPANGNGWAFVWLFLGSEFQNAATNSCLALKS